MGRVLKAAMYFSCSAVAMRIFWSLAVGLTIGIADMRGSGQKVGTIFLFGADLLKLVAMLLVFAAPVLVYRIMFREPPSEESRQQVQKDKAMVKALTLFFLSYCVVIFLINLAGAVLAGVHVLMIEGPLVVKALGHTAAGGTSLVLARSYYRRR